MPDSILITGATTGIGLELAKLFAKNKFDIVITARNENSLNNVAESLRNGFHAGVIPIQKDLSVPGSAEELYLDIRKRNIGISILINNAGFGNYGSFSRTDLNTEIQMIQLNVISLTVLTKLFLEDMLKNDSGKIMNVASTAAFQPGPGMAIYYATKAFVLSFSEAVAEELSGSNVTLTVLCPGPTKTEFQKRAGSHKTKLVRKKLAGMMSPARVAEIGYYGLMKGKRIIIPGLVNKLIVQLERVAPRKLLTWAVNFIHKE